MRRSAVLLIALFLASYLMMGCDGNNADKPAASSSPKQASTSQTSQQSITRQETPSESLSKLISSATSTSFTLSAHKEKTLWGDHTCSEPLAQPSQGSGDACFNTTVTVKGKNIRIDGISRDGKPTFAIYNYTKKQVAYVGDISGGIAQGGEIIWNYGTTGWKKADSDLEKQQNVIKNVLDQNFYGDRFPEGALNVKKEGTSYLFNINADQNIYILECAGPNGLPSRLIKEVPAYGANPKTDTVIIELQYSNVNQIPDSMFELDSSIQVFEGGAEISLGGVFGDNNSSLHPSYLDGSVAQ